MNEDILLQDSIFLPWGNKAVSSWFQFLVEELTLDGRWYMKGILQLQKGN